MENPSSPSSMPSEGAVLGRYQLIRLLGRGGMGAVYEALHLELGRRAAIKMLHPRYAASADARRRFLREGQTASRIRHPNIADVYDVGIQEDYPYLVIEFLEGEDLARLMAREGALGFQRAADIMVPVAAAVAAAHDLGIVHRDLKPANIFLSHQRNRIQPKVLDFGISKSTDTGPDPSLTDTGSILGTPSYMSPEQAQGSKDIDIRSDQYSLGVILYECVTGKRPVEEPSPFVLVQRIVRGDFAPPRQHYPGLASGFEELILRAMARDRAERFPSTRDFGRALLSFASDTVRSSYEDEMATGVQVRRPEFPAPALAEHDAGLRTTLGESVLQRDVPRHHRSRWPWLGIGFAVLASGGVLLLQFLGSIPRRSPNSAAHATAVQPSLAPATVDSHVGGEESDRGQGPGDEQERSGAASGTALGASQSPVQPIAPAAAALPPAESPARIPVVGPQFRRDTASPPVTSSAPSHAKGPAPSKSIDPIFLRH